MSRCRCGALLWRVASALNLSTTTAPHNMAKAESSKAAAKNGVRANPNAPGGANYELPW